MGKMRWAKVLRFMLCLAIAALLLAYIAPMKAYFPKDKCAKPLSFGKYFSRSAGTRTANNFVKLLEALG